MGRDVSRLFDWFLRIDYPNRRVSDLPLIFVTPRELLELRNTANVVNVCMYGSQAWDIDENEVGAWNGHRLFLLGTRRE